MCEHHFKCIDLIVLQISTKQLQISKRILTTFQVSCAWFIYGASGGSSLFRGFLSHSFCHLVFMYLCMIGLNSEGGVSNGCMLLLMINGNDQNCIHMGIYVQLSCKSSTDAVCS